MPYTPPPPPRYEQVCLCCGYQFYTKSKHDLLCPNCQIKAKVIAEPPITRILACLKLRQLNSRVIVEDVLTAIEKADFLLLDIHKFEESLGESVEYIVKVRTDAKRIAKEILNAPIPEPQAEINESLCEFGCAKAYPCNLVKRVRELEARVEEQIWNFSQTKF